MTHFIAKDGSEIFLNLTSNDRLDDDSTNFSTEAIGALKLIKSISSTQQLSSEHLAAIDIIFEEGVCLSPYSIFELPLHRDICRHFNEISQLGSDLREELANAGAFAFLERVHNRATSQGIVERILCVFTASAIGLEKTSDAPLDFVHAVVDHFRSEDGLGWNRELLGVGDVATQCVSNIINGLAKVFNDPRLVHKARKHRSTSAGKNPGWYAFERSKDILDQELRDLYKDFRDDTRMRPEAAQSAVLNMASWLRAAFPNEGVRNVALSAARPHSFTAFLTKRNGGKVSRSLLSAVEAARKFSLSISEQLADTHGVASPFDLVSQKEVNKLKNELAKHPKPSRTRSRPLPEKLIPILREILEEGAKGWPGRHFRVDIISKGKLYNRYCPVIPSLFKAMLDIPLRMGQIRRLDSGEGDVRHFNGDEMQWQENKGLLAGYWAELVGEPREGFPTRGYAIEIEDEIKPVTGIWANTNKTGEPWAIPWHIPSLLKNLWELRKWQEKYNPILLPVGPESYLDAPQHYSETTKAEMPKIFPISRLLPNTHWPMPGRTVTSSEIDHAWCSFLLETQLRWNKRHPGAQVTLVDIHPKSRQPFRPRYNIHGLRVRGLTNLRRGGMSLELLSKFIAGHASIVMTIYYTEPHPSEVAEQVEKAVASSSAQRKFIDDLKRMDVDEALKRTVWLSPSAVPAAIESASQFQFCNVAIGVCPYDGSACSDGGPLLRRDSGDGVSKNVYGPVEPRNCVMCRHFISGPPWLNELADYGTKLCERRQYLAAEERRINDLASHYELASKGGTLGSAEFENGWEELGADMQQVKNEQETLENAIFNVELLCNASVKLLDRDPTGEAGVMLVANSRSSVINYLEVSEFDQAVRITAAGRIHQILGDERVERKRDEYLNLMLFNSGVTPPGMITNVSREHRRRAMDQYAQFINAKASNEEIESLVEGTLRLRDLGIEEQVRDLIDVALSEPILLPGSGRRAKPTTLGVMA